jgi:integrase
MRGRRNLPLDFTSVNETTPLTFDTIALAYLEDYVLHQYRTLTTARARVEHLRVYFGGQPADAITADTVRNYQTHRRKEGAEAATINRETSALSRIIQLAIRRGRFDRMPIFPKRLLENPPRQGFFEHNEYLKVRAQLPTAFQDVLDFAYYSGWRRKEITQLTWDEVDLRGGVIRFKSSALKDTHGAGVADLAAPTARVGTAPPSAAAGANAGVSAGRCNGPRVATRAPGRLSSRQGPPSPAPRLPAHGCAEPRARRGAGARGDVAYRSQNARRV